MIPSDLHIFVCTEVVDMRYGFDRLAAEVRRRLGDDPQSGRVFVFANRGATRLKVLWFDRNGYCVLYKRLHRAIFDLPLSANQSISVRIDRAALAKLLAGVQRHGAHSRAGDRTVH